MVPLPEDLQILEENRAIAKELTKEEQYLMEICKVPGIKSHLDSLEVKFSFSDRFLSMNKYLQQLKSAWVAVRDNDELKQVILMLLKIGNYLNQGSKKGNQVSFNVDLLSNLKSSKALGTHSKSSMLDFLLNSILSKSPSTA